MFNSRPRRFNQGDQHTGRVGVNSSMANMTNNHSLTSIDTASAGQLKAARSSIRRRWRSSCAQAGGNRPGASSAGVGVVDCHNTPSGTTKELPVVQLSHSSFPADPAPTFRRKRCQDSQLAHRRALGNPTGCLSPPTQGPAPSQAIGFLCLLWLEQCMGVP